MEDKNKGGPAFPHAMSSLEKGMTLRDYLAAKAMQGFAADPNVNWDGGVSEMARVAYSWADAMLAERERV